MTADWIGLVVIAVLQVATPQAYVVITPVVTLGMMGFAAVLVTHIVMIARWTARLQTIQESDHDEIKDLRKYRHEHDGRIIKLESGAENERIRMAHLEDNIQHLEELQREG